MGIFVGKWVLIALLGVQSFQVDGFDSEKACEVARDKIINNTIVTGGPIYVRTRTQRTKEEMKKLLKKWEEHAKAYEKEHRDSPFDKDFVIAMGPKRPQEIIYEISDERDYKAEVLRTAKSHPNFTCINKGD